MTATGDTAQTRTDATAPQAAKVWVLDDPRAGTSSQTIGIAERLGVPFRCIPLTWNWMAHIAGLVPSGSLIGLAAATRRALQTGGATIALPRTGLVTTPGPHPSGGLHDSPDLVISAARRSGAVALWMKSRYGCRIVHCMNPGIGGLLRRDQFDLLVVPGHDNLPPAPNQMQVLGAPHRISALHLHQARAAWRERLAHLPRPLVALMVGGPPRSTDMQPALAHALGRRVARLVSAPGAWEIGPPPEPERCAVLAETAP